MKAPLPGPGEAIRTLRKRSGLTLTELSGRTGLAVSTLSKIEMGHVSLSYDKLMLISKSLGVDMAELLDTTPHPPGPPTYGQRRVIHRAGEGQQVETRSYSQIYLATELLNKRCVPIYVELHARTLDEFLAEFGDLIRHPGEEFTYVIEGEVAFHTDLYAPAILRAGDSLYFDSEMGHAYLKAVDGPCRLVTTCSPRGRDETMMDTFVTASVKHAGEHAASRKTVAGKRVKSPAK
ncbi:MAG: XRE family transcriptional regulator [Pseudomonadota bacterium]|nr:XRE family transcriptional regulator [Pseudomonadota bacterium]